ncbi:MAG: hypothetical protein ABIJ09_27260 [Pseudomonadota bacterium]
MTSHPERVLISGVLGLAAQMLAGCPSLAVGKTCQQDSQCPQFFHCDRARGACVVGVGAGDSGASLDAIGLEHALLDARPLDSRALDGATDAAEADDAAMRDAHHDGARPDLFSLDGRALDASQVDHDVTLDAASADLTLFRDVEGVDALALRCDARLYVDPDPPVAGQILQVHFYSSADLGVMELHVSGPGSPQARSTTKFCVANPTTCTYGFEVDQLQTGLLQMTLTYSQGYRLAQCEKIVVPGG